MTYDCKFSDMFSVASLVINIKKPCNFSEGMNVLAFLLGFSNTIPVTNDELYEHVMVPTSGDRL